MIQHNRIAVCNCVPHQNDNGERKTSSNQRTQRHHWKSWVFTGALCWIAVVSVAQPSNGQTSRPATPDFPPRDGPPFTRSGGSRGCGNAQPMTPLVPQGAVQGGRTTAAFPTFWIQVPYRLTPDNIVQFDLLNQEGRVVYRARFPAPSTEAGMISVALPSGIAPPLVVGETYHWLVMLFCDGVADSPGDLAEGWVQRVELPAAVTRQLATAAPTERSNLYAAQLVWYDALTVLAEERRRNPGDRLLTERWNHLLKLPSVGLDALTTAPFTACCVLPASQ